MKDITTLQSDAIALLCQLIETPSFSREEDQTTALINAHLNKQGVDTICIANNVIAKNYYFDECKPSILLNSHHDTVKPNIGYTLNPFEPIIKDGKLFGLGSNDAGGCLVSLIACFIFFYKEEDLPFNIILAASAEEEISGNDGVELLLKHELFKAFAKFQSDNWVAIVGEPTLMQMAVAEKGLMVVDAYAKGKAGHAAREEGDNALYIAMKDIHFIAQMNMEKVSPFLGPVKATVTVVETENKQHNVVPTLCHFVIDIRLNEYYSPEDILEYLKENLQSDIQERSMRLRSTAIDIEHPLVQAGINLGKSYYGSPTTSDKALMPFSALKMGPGDSSRSHAADEFIHIEEIENGIVQYIDLITEARKYYGK